MAKGFVLHCCLSLGVCALPYHADCVPKHRASEEGHVFGVSGGTVISGGSAFSGGSYFCVGGSAPARTKQCQEPTATIKKSQTTHKQSIAVSTQQTYATWQPVMFLIAVDT